MHRLKLNHEFKYEFLEPRHSRFVMWLGWYYTLRKLKYDLKIKHIQFHNLDRLEKLLGSGDGILIAPNHSDHADSALMVMLGQKLKHPFFFMATHAIFTRASRYLLPRIGAFPVDREGTDTRALRKAQEILSAGQSPLVIFPEGEIYRLNDLITPLRDGVAAVATTSARKARERGHKVWVVPVGIKYRFTDDADPMPWMLKCMTRLEQKFNWRPKPELSLLERLYRYATGMLSLKEIEFLGGVRAGSVPDRVQQMREHVLENVEARLGLSRARVRSNAVPERVKECRRVILEKLVSPDRDPALVPQWKEELENLFFVVQLYSYPGDYVRNRPTCERAWEILVKFQQDAMLKDVDRARYHVPRRADLYFGEPIDVNELMATASKKPAEAADADANATSPEKEQGTRSRKAMSTLTHTLEVELQKLLDMGDPGRPLPGTNAIH